MIKINLKKINEENKAIMVLDKVLRSSYKGIGLLDMFDTEIDSKGRTVGKMIDIRNVSKDEFNEFTEKISKIRGLNRVVECSVKVRELNPKRSIYVEEIEIPVYGLVGYSDIIGSFCVIENKVVMYVKRQSSMKYSNKAIIEMLVGFLREQGFEVNCYEKEFYEDTARETQTWVISKEAFENE